MELSIGILAGGKSSRMGSNKAFIKLYQETFLDIIINELSDYKDIIVSIGNIEEYKELPYLFVEDEIKEIGPIEGIRQVIENSENFYTFVCATDMPFIKKEIVEYMTQFISSDYDCYVISTEDGIHPLCAIYSKNTLDTFKQSINDGNYKLLDLISKVKTKYIDLKYTNFSNKILGNINTKEDYENIKRVPIFCVSGIKNSGKTTLITKLIKEFKNDFPRIAVIKHDGHDFVIDSVKTDTGKFLDAGAIQVSIFSEYKYASIIQESNVSIEKIIEKTKNVDMIIIEGMKKSKYPKIEIVRDGVSDKSVCNKNELIAIATDILNISNNESVKIIPLSDVKEISKTIRGYFFAK